MKILFGLLFSVFAFVLLVKYLERVSVFFPSREMVLTPKDILLDHENVFFKTSDEVVLHGWFVPHVQPRGTVLFFHGNAGNISHRLSKISLFHRLGLNVFIINYRGYGQSKGQPTEQGIYKDAVAAFDYLTKRPDIDRRRLLVYGESLGGVVAIDLATQRPVAGLIIDSSFSSAADMAKTIYPFVPSFLLSIQMDSLSKVASLDMPKVFFHSRADDIVPFALGVKLFEAARRPKELVELTGGHNTGYESSEQILFETIDQWLNERGWSKS
jgi:uncharacterized protein